jgi:hypothetical protein
MTFKMVRNCQKSYWVAKMKASLAANQGKRHLWLVYMGGSECKGVESAN